MELKIQRLRKPHVPWFPMVIASETYIPTPIINRCSRENGDAKEEPTENPEYTYTDSVILPSDKVLLLEGPFHGTSQVEY
jgi:hypothetical protein